MGVVVVAATGRAAATGSGPILLVDVLHVGILLPWRRCSSVVKQALRDLDRWACVDAIPAGVTGYATRRERSLTNDAYGISQARNTC
jgi:hypothetical protein